MKILNVIQGSPAWQAARFNHFCASDAPAMMGASSHMTRSELIRRKATGDVPAIDPMTQERFDKGHRAEAAARPIIEKLIGEDLYPTTATDDDDYLLASFDGVTMDGETGFEHKLFNAELIAEIRAGIVSPMYAWQMEQQILIAGLKRVLFVCSDGTEQNMARTIYYPVAGRAEQLLAGWKQFEDDVKNYQHVEVIHPPTATPTLALPAVSIKVEGAVALISNLDVFGAGLKAFIARLPEKPSTDQEFADCKAACKTLQEAQDALDAAEAHALGQVASFDEMKRTKALYFDLARNTRLAVEKLVIAREQQIKVEIRQTAHDAFALHVSNLNKRIGKPYLSVPAPDWVGAMKNKRTIASLRDAVDTLLAQSKITANELADRISLNLGSLALLGKGYEFLFADEAQIVLKAGDDFIALVKNRIAEHAGKVAKLAEEAREKIRQEEEAKVQQKLRDAVLESMRTNPPSLPTRSEVEQLPSTVPAFQMGVQQPVQPDDESLIHAIAILYKVDAGEVIRWLRAIDLDAVAKRLEHAA